MSTDQALKSQSLVFSSMTNYRLVPWRTDGRWLMAQRRNSRALSLRQRWWLFFYNRCLAGFPWFWPARPPGENSMVDARRIVRQHYGRGYHPAYRTFANIVAMILC